MTTKKEEIKMKPLGGDTPCSKCGTTRNPRWFTDNVFWNSVTGDELVHNDRNDINPGSILCIGCFVEAAQEKYDVHAWRLIPEFNWKEHPQHD